MILIRNFSALALLLYTTAPVFATNYVLQNDFVKAGVNETTGTLGSGGGTRPGLQYDSTGTGTFPADTEQGDYLTPGSPFEGFTVKIDQFGADGVEGGTDDNTTSYTNNNTGATGISGGAWVTTPDTTSAVWAATSTNFAIQNSYSLPAGQQYIDINTQITALSNIDRLQFGRFIDPDAMPAAGDTSSTDNVLGYSGIPGTNVVFSEATVSRYALGLYSSANNVGAGISSGWSTDPSTYYAGGDYAVGNGDHTIGLGFLSLGLTAGDIVNYQYAYIFGPSAFDAATYAIDGGAGGGTAGVVPGGGTLTDVGSATDAASGPTVVGSSSSSVTNHTATDDGKTQTISRSRSTSTWDVYSDGSLGTPVVSTSTLTPFTGSIDQIESGLAILRDAGKTKTSEMGLTFGRSSGAADTRIVTSVISNELDSGTTLGVRYDVLSIDEYDLIAKMRAFGLSASRTTDAGEMSLSLDKSRTDLAYARDIGTFTNYGSTVATDTSISGKIVMKDILEKPVEEGEEKKESLVKLHPVIGLTVGKRTVAGYTESSSVQSSRVVDGTTERYSTLAMGAKADVGPVSIEAIHYTDGVDVVSASFDYDVEKFGSVYVKGTKTFSEESTGTVVSAGVAIKF